MDSASIRYGFTVVHMDDAYTDAVRRTIKVELTARDWDRHDLADRSGLTYVTIGRILRGERDLTMPYLVSLAGAFGWTAGELLLKAEDRLRPGSHPAASVTAQRGEDPRTLIRYLMDHPDNDGTLQARLGELRRESGASGRTLAAVEREMVLNRRTELSRALDALPPANSA